MLSVSRAGAAWLGAATQLIVRRIVDSRNFEYNFYQAELPLMLKLKKTPALEREDVDPRLRQMSISTGYLSSCVKYWG